MSELLAARNLAAAHLVVVGLILVWDLWVARRTAQLRTSPRLIALLSALAGLLLIPAFTVLLVSSSLLTGRALYTIAWVWPLTTTLIAGQAVLAVRRGLAAPAIGIPIAAFDILLAAISIIQYAVFRGLPVAQPLLALVAASRGALALTVQPRALLLPQFAYVPILAPSAPSRRGGGTVLRTAVATVAALWGTLIVLDVPAAAIAVRSYASHGTLPIQERADSDFAVGLKILPTLDGGPPPLALERDLGLADSLGVGALSIYLTPDGASGAVLDSLERTLDAERGDKLLLVALDLSGEPPLALTQRESYFAARAADLERIVTRLHPDFVVPVVDPNGAAARALGGMAADDWVAYLRDAATRVHAVGSGRTGVMVHTAGTGPADSTLFAWAAALGSPVDAVGVSLFPWLNGAATLEAHTKTLDRWLAARGGTSPVWVLEAGGFPLSHGEQSQADAILGSLSWATGHEGVKGFVVFEASDYATPLGLRAADGRLRPAARAVSRGIKALGP